MHLMLPPYVWHVVTSRMLWNSVFLMFRKSISLFSVHFVICILYKYTLQHNGKLNFSINSSCYQSLTQIYLSWMKKFKKTQLLLCPTPPSEHQPHHQNTNLINFNKRCNTITSQTHVNKLPNLACLVQCSLHRL